MSPRGPSAHLSWSELACKDEAHTPYPEEWRETRAVTLATEFEAIRAAVGAPVRIGSGYRTPAHNRAVGGSKASQHMEGRALDLYPPTGMSIGRLYLICRDRARVEESAIGGIGRYPTFVHIDVRPMVNGRLILWQGSRAWAEDK